MILQSKILEKLTKCNFHVGTRESALELHEQGMLIPQDPDIAIWTDRSLTGECPDMDPNCGAAALVQISNTDVDKRDEHTCIVSKLMIPNAVSSYETEIIAIQAGLEAVLPINPIGRKSIYSLIHCHVYNS